MNLIASNALWAFLMLSSIHNVLAFSSRSSRISGVVHHRTKNSITSLNDNKSDSLDSITDEIEMMKRNALQKLDELDNKISNKNSQAGPEMDTVVVTPSVAKAAPSVETVDEESESAYVARRLSERIDSDRIAVSNDPSIITSTGTSIRGRKRDEALLDSTSWKLSLDIGREPGTWMPKDWGVSGSRLKLDFEFEFSDKQLYEREDFLGGIGDAKIVSVKDSIIVLSPSLTENRREIPVKNGGWRVSRGKGPMGSDLLRFYIEIDEEVSRKNGDVYCPAGRIYCSCGFFNMDRPSNGEKARYKKILDAMITRAEALDEEIAAAGFLEKLKKNAEMIRLKVQMQETADRYRGASALEPDSSILRFSEQGDVGLTKEGGVCCKVNKGMAIEYHILGRFYIRGK